MKKNFPFSKHILTRKSPTFEAQKNPQQDVMDFNFTGAWHYLLLN